jgi:dTDP-4-dehydrorhamnose reductase
MIKKRICIIGSNGMLGQRLVLTLEKRSNIELMCCSAEGKSYINTVDYMQVDITNKKDVQSLFHYFYPDVIINTAAYTNVDGCETEKELSYKINVTGVENIAKQASAIDAHLIHISSDYVFDGTAGPYEENDKPNPISAYGRSKLAGENVLNSSNLKSTILRTNVLYGPAKYGRPDFVKWVVNSLKANKPINIVTDQINNPTYIDDLVSAIINSFEFNKTGIFHIGGSEFLSRYEFTLRIADFFKLNKNIISKILTKDLNQPAPRPLKSGLITLKAQTELGYSASEISNTFSRMKIELNL